jgi:hypothetical protein
MPGLHPFANADDIFLADGPPVRAAGIPFDTRMIVVKLSSGALWINSPVSMSLEIRDCLAALGPVKYLVAPTKLHVWRLTEAHALFPNAELRGPPQIPRAFKNLPFTGILDNTPPSGWAGDLDQLLFRGNWFLEEAHFLHKTSRTVIVGDFIQNHRLARSRPFLNWLLQLAGAAWPNGGVPIDIRSTFFRRDLARQSLAKLLSWDFDKLILAHGVCIEHDARPFVERAFRWLLP